MYLLKSVILYLEFCRFPFRCVCVCVCVYVCVCICVCVCAVRMFLPSSGRMDSDYGVKMTESLKTVCYIGCETHQKI